MSPFAAFLFLLGIETLHVRMERHVQNAQALAQWLRKHPAVEWVNYPGLPTIRTTRTPRSIFRGAGAIVGFGIRGGKEAGVKFINSVKLASHLANIGDAKTLVIHPGVHDPLAADRGGAAVTGVSPEYVRVSVGIEDIDDIEPISTRPCEPPRVNSATGEPLISSPGATMKHFIGIVLCAAAALAQQPQIPLEDGQIVPLWTGQAPGALGTADADIPTLTVYLPRTTPQGMTAVIICPGREPTSRSP